MDGSKVGSASNDTDNWPLIKRIAREFVDEDEDSFDFAVVMVAAIFEGANVERIARVTGCSRDFVSRVGARLEKSGIWTQGVTDYHKWDHTSKSGFVGFVMDLGVAQGILVRTRETRNGEHVCKSNML